MPTLYEFQKRAVKELIDGKHLCSAKVGTGKGSISLWWAKAQNKPKLLVITTASKRDVKNADGLNDFEAEADMWFPGWRASLSSFSVISWAGLAKWYAQHQHELNDYAIIGDECLPADTKVKTRTGNKKISDIKIGDMVASYNHDSRRIEYKQVTRLIKKRSPKTMMRLLLSNGIVIISTDNHPHWTQRGYIMAKDIKKGDYLYEGQDGVQKTEVWARDRVCNMWEENTNRADDPKTDGEDTKQSRVETMLFKKLYNKKLEQPDEKTVGDEQRSHDGGEVGAFKKMVGGASRSKTKRSRSSETIYLYRGVDKEIYRENYSNKQRREYKSKSSGDKKEEWMETDMGGTPRIKRRERALYRTTNKTSRKIKPSIQGLDNGTASSTWRKKRKRLSDLLQIRHRECVLQNRNRVRWSFAQLGDSKKKRQEEGEQIRGIRVERVEVLKLRDIKRLGLYRDPDYVYCIDVEDNHNFFANGVLTHNCAMAKAGVSSIRGRTFLKIAKATNCWTGYSATFGDSWIDYYAYFVATEKVRNKTVFMRKFCEVQTYKGYPEIVKYRDTDTLKQWWKDISVKVDSSEADKQLPPESHHTIEFKCPPKYKETLKNRKHPETGEFIDSTMGLCATLRQMCLTKEKLAWLKDYTESLGERAVFFYNFIEEGNQVEKALRSVLPKEAKIWRIDGKTHDVPTAETVGKYDVVLAQWQAGSMGLNLQFMQQWVSVSPNYSWSISEQARGRIKRIGQAGKHMDFWYLCCENSIEKDIYKILKTKGTFNEELWLKEKEN